MHTVDKRISDRSDIDSFPFTAPMKPRANRRFRHTQQRRN